MRSETTKDKSGMLPPAVYTNNNDKFVLKDLHPTVNHPDESGENDELVLDDDF